MGGGWTPLPYQLVWVGPMTQWLTWRLIDLIGIFYWKSYVIYIIITTKTLQVAKNQNGDYILLTISAGHSLLPSGSHGLAKPITPHERRPPACPVVRLSSNPPLPRSSRSACTYMATEWCILFNAHYN